MQALTFYSFTDTFLIDEWKNYPTWSQQATIGRLLLISSPPLFPSCSETVNQSLSLLLFPSSGIFLPQPILLETKEFCTCSSDFPLQTPPKLRWHWWYDEVRRSKYLFWFLLWFRQFLLWFLLLWLLVELLQSSRYNPLCQIVSEKWKGTATFISHSCQSNNVKSLKQQLLIRSYCVVTCQVKEKYWMHHGKVLNASWKSTECVMENYWPSITSPTPYIWITHHSFHALSNRWLVWPLASWSSPIRVQKNHPPVTCF